MTEEQFWAIIDESRKQMVSPRKQHVALEEILAKLPENEIEAFANQWLMLRNEAYRWDLWNVARIIGGGCGDDSFTDFRSWLIGRGRDYYSNALCNAASAAKDAEVGNDSCFYERLGYAMDKAYERVSGYALPYSNVPKHPSEPKGQRLSDEELRTKYPELCQRFDF